MNKSNQRSSLLLFIFSAYNFNQTLIPLNHLTLHAFAVEFNLNSIIFFGASKGKKAHFRER